MHTTFEQIKRKEVGAVIGHVRYAIYMAFPRTWQDLLQPLERNISNRHTLRIEYHRVNFLYTLRDTQTKASVSGIVAIPRSSERTDIFIRDSLENLVSFRSILREFG